MEVNPVLCLLVLVGMISGKAGNYLNETAIFHQTGKSSAIHPSGRHRGTLILTGHNSRKHLPFKRSRGWLISFIERDNAKNT